METERDHYASEAQGAKLAYACGVTRRVCCRGEDPRQFCSRCKAAHIDSIVAQERAREQTLDGALIESARYYVTSPATAADLSYGAARDLAGEGPYTRALAARDSVPPAQRRREQPEREAIDALISSVLSGPLGGFVTADDLRGLRPNMLHEWARRSVEISQTRGSIGPDGYSVAILRRQVAEVRNAKKGGAR